MASERGTDGEWKRVMELCGQGYAKERIERETEEAVERLMEEVRGLWCGVTEDVVNYFRRKVMHLHPFSPTCFVAARVAG